MLLTWSFTCSFSALPMPVPCPSLLTCPLFPPCPRISPCRGSHPARRSTPARRFPQSVLLPALSAEIRKKKVEPSRR
ncbi:Uncharacterized protein APZ42_007085 [Daphnia magna]|uniref:Secreted protein n=1 Tax=Daphnia magna TaxID=35525 RepID=A0A162D2H0_9CRUS|nr:Uncharacterized protein APZ42_007085 [Daphnia magna]